MRTLYLRRGLLDAGPECRVLHIRPLLRELIFETVNIGALRNRNVVERAMRDILVAELRRASAVPTGVGLPTDGRALIVAHSVIADPAMRIRLSALCASAGISVRTLERIFRKEVGFDFESWRRQVRLMKAIGLLVSGSSVKEAAYSVGYQQPSAFVALFRTTFAATPKAWISAIRRL